MLSDVFKFMDNCFPEQKLILKVGNVELNEKDIKESESTCYVVRFSANINDSQHPAYVQGYQAFIYDKCCASWNTPGDVTIQEKFVKAITATAAIMKFQKWQNNGKPESWLMEL